MKAKLNIEHTYLGHLHKLQYATPVIDEEQLQQALWQLKNVARLHNTFMQAPVYFAIDYTKSKYLFFSNALGDHSAAEIMDGGLDKMIGLMPPNYLKTHNEKLFPALLAFLKNNKQADANLLVSFNQRIISRQGKNIDTYQRCKYILCKQSGLPTHCLGTAFNISGLSNNSLNINFENLHHNNPQAVAENLCFFPDEESSLLTAQEKKVVALLADGLNSREIAAVLFISQKTVANHRANILRKTQAKNTASLLAGGPKKASI